MKYKIVGSDHAFPQCLWSKYFIEGQVYAVKDIKFWQVNTSDMLMIKNGKESIKNQRKKSECNTTL